MNWWLPANAYVAYIHLSNLKQLHATLGEYYLVEDKAKKSHPPPRTPSQIPALNKKASYSSFRNQKPEVPWHLHRALKHLTHISSCLLACKHSPGRSAHCFVRYSCNSSEFLSSSLVNYNKSKTPQLQQVFPDHFTEQVWRVPLVILISLVYIIWRVKAWSCFRAWLRVH